MIIESVNPATGKQIEQFEAMSIAHIDQALERSSQAFESWRETDFTHRAELIQKVADKLRSNKQRYAKVLTHEMGKTIVEARAEVEKCALVCDYYALNAKRILAPRPNQSDAGESFARYDPIGPVLAVMPWNFPFWQVFRFAAPAIMAGNVAVLKHASNVPRTALEIEQVFTEAGSPKGLFTTLMIGSGQVERVIRDPRIRAVTLTGSESAGRSVAKIAGSVLKKTVLELGGSDAFIVLEDADLTGAAKSGALSRLLNNGQSCIAAKRFIVVKDVAENFIELLKAEMERWTMGDPMDETTKTGPMARADLRDQLHDQVTRAINSGAHLLLGGQIPDGLGYFYPPSLLVNVAPDNPVMREETFGPLAVVCVVENEAQAISVANDSKFGLGGAVWTATLARGKAIAARLDTGAVFINGFTKSDPRLPFGGTKNSGYGRELSDEGIREFVNIKTVWIAG
jgi:succinate-semialdehyde dehydrogenase/glutarate-semialdehyde dehydrogenase